MSTTNPSDYKRLLEAARSALSFSYSPYSRYPVGAAVLTKKGSIVTGSNIENASYGLTICAERVAVFKAVSQGESEIAAIAVVCGKGDTCVPCGACRQVISEFSKDGVIVFEGKNGEVVIKQTSELLPMAFSQKYLQ